MTTAPFNHVLDAADQFVVREWKGDYASALKFTLASNYWGDGHVICLAWQRALDRDSSRAIRDLDKAQLPEYRLARLLLDLDKMKLELDSLPTANGTAQAVGKLRRLLRRSVKEC